MVGRDMVDRFPARSTHPIGDVTFAIEDWTVFHPLDQQRKVVDGVSHQRAPRRGRRASPA